jgi:hypothetical protein
VLRGGPIRRRRRADALIDGAPVDYSSTAVRVHAKVTADASYDTFANLNLDAIDSTTTDPQAQIPGIGDGPLLDGWPTS